MPPELLGGCEPVHRTRFRPFGPGEAHLTGGFPCGGGVFGGVGVDLCGVRGACKVIRVAAADAERLRPTPF